MKRLISIISLLVIGQLMYSSCNQVENKKTMAAPEPGSNKSEKPVFFNLRPQLEKEYGYTHAAKIGNDLKISGAVSMNDSGSSSHRVIWNNK